MTNNVLYLLEGTLCTSLTIRQSHVIIIYTVFQQLHISAYILILKVHTVWPHCNLSLRDIVEIPLISWIIDPMCKSFLACKPLTR